MKPYEFIPERFDHESPYAKDADGHMRSPYSWMPFGGGHRICMGRTFTDYIVKSCLTIATQNFDFNLVEEGMYCKSNMPLIVHG